MRVPYSCLHFHFLKIDACTSNNLCAENCTSQLSERLHCLWFLQEKSLTLQISGNMTSGNIWKSRQNMRKEHAKIPKTASPLLLFPIGY